MQGTHVTQKMRVTAMTDRAEVLQIELREERIAIPQVRIVRAQARLKNLAAFADQLKTLERSFPMTIISSQIAERLFAFEDRRRSDLCWRGSLSSYVGTISALRQSHFNRASGIAVRLRAQRKARRFSLECLAVSPWTFVIRAPISRVRAPSK